MSRYSYDSVTDTLKLISGATQANDIYISGIEESSTASQAYTVGSYLIYSKVLYKVILAIAQGDTLAPGTNIQSTRVADEINSHLCVDGNEFYFDSHDGKFGYNTSPSRGADTFSPFNSGNNIVDLQDGYGHYYTYVNSFVEHNEKIVKDSYIQNHYNRGVFNLKGANVSTLKIYNSSQNSNCVFSIIGIKGDGTIIFVYGGNAMTEQTKDVSDIELLTCACYVGQCRLYFS